MDCFIVKSVFLASHFCNLLYNNLPWYWYCFRGRARLGRKGRFWCAECNSVNRTCSASTLLLMPETSNIPRLFIDSASASGWLRPPGSLPGLCPRTRWGTFVPQTPNAHCPPLFQTMAAPLKALCISAHHIELTHLNKVALRCT